MARQRKASRYARVFGMSGIFLGGGGKKGKGIKPRERRTVNFEPLEPRTMLRPSSSMTATPALVSTTPAPTCRSAARPRVRQHRCPATPLIFSPGQIPTW